MDHEGPRSRALMVSVGLWIVSAIPVIAMGTLHNEDSPRDLTGLGVVGTLILVAAGLHVFLPTNWAAATHELLAKHGRSRADVHDSEADRSEAIGVLAAVYWPVMVAAYLI